MALSTTAANRKDLNTGRDNSVTFQHRHFAKIAAIIADIPDAGYRADMAMHFADKLDATNPNFNRDRFLAACMVKA